MEKSNKNSILKTLAIVVAILGALAVVSAVAISLFKKMKKTVKDFNEDITPELDEEGEVLSEEADCQVSVGDAEE